MKKKEYRKMFRSMLSVITDNKISLKTKIEVIDSFAHTVMLELKDDSESKLRRNTAIAVSIAEQIKQEMV